VLGQKASRCNQAEEVFSMIAQGKTSAKVCFVIAPIDDEGTPIRERSDEILDYIIRPVAVACGYDRVMRADEISKPGMITTDIVQHLLEDDLVVADLTGRNPNVFYELAVRHAIRMPVVQMIQAAESIPFDLSQSRTIRVRYPGLKGAEECRQQLERQIKEAEEDPAKADNPISQAIDLLSWRKSGNPVAESNAEITALLHELLGRVAGVRDTLSSPNSPLLRQMTDTARREVLDELDRILG
jgi:hypothetical protein